MKRFFLILIVCFQSALSAQNYNVFPIGSSQMFFNADSVVLSVAVDSSFTLGSDTHFLLKRELERFDSVYNKCYGTPYGSTFLGKQIIENNSEITFVFTYDSFTLKRRGNKVSVYNGDTVWVNYLGVKLDTLFNGQTDSLETYSVTCNTQNIYCWPNTVIEISKSNGIISFPRIFKKLPFFFSIYIKADQLSRISYNPLTFKDISNFNVGDEFHYSARDEFHNGQTYPLVTTFIWNYTVISKTVLTNKISYKYYRKTLEKERDNISQTWTSKTYFDTIVVNRPTKKTVISPVGSYEISDTATPGAMSFSVHLKKYKIKDSTSLAFHDGPFHLVSDTCYQFNFALTSGESIYVVTKGIGEVYQYNEGGASNTSTFVKELFYYKIGNSIWGGPKYISVEENKLLGIKIYPNPATNILNINVPTFVDVADLRLLNISGQVVLKTQLLSDKNQIQISELPSGVYFLEIEQGGKIIRKKIIVQK